jgi:glycosyltransferase involved in cell wall biosynthesis
MKFRRIAVVTDVMMSVGGGEVVTEGIMKVFPKADFYTLFFTPTAKERFQKKFPEAIIHTSWWQILVKKDQITKYISMIKIFSWLYWEFLRLDKYDLIISSSNSYISKNVKKGKNSFHVSYIHAPPRYLYDEFNQIGWIKKKPWKWCFRPVMLFLRSIDRRGIDRPDVMMAASKFVQRRIKKYYGRDSIVLYPPVEIKKVNVKKQDYYICLSRLVKQKGMELIVKMCTNNNLTLKVVGEGYERKKLEKIAGENVDFLGNKFNAEKAKLLAGAKALIYTSHEEDFGIVPVEALMVGTPVVAYNSGGVTETVIDGKNGVLFNDFSEKSLLEAINKLETLNIKPNACIESVSKFSRDNFEKNLLNIINTIVYPAF